MSKQIDFLKRCIALNLQSGGLLDLLDRIEELERKVSSRDAEVTDLLKQNVMLCMYLSQIAWGNTAKQQSAWAEEALNKTQELSKLILCSKDHVAITKNDSEVEFFHIIPQKTLLYRAITDIRKVL